MSDFAYIRVSTTGQSTARQLDHLDLSKMMVFEEKASAKSINRPKLKECLMYLREGDTLHVHSIDRLARNMIDLREIVDKLVARGVTIHFHKEGQIYNNEASNLSKLLLGMLGVFAEFERSIIVERVNEGIAKAKAEGKRLGRKPLDLSRSAEAKDLKDKGLSCYAIAKIMNLSRPSVTKLLKT